MVNGECGGANSTPRVIESGSVELSTRNETTVLEIVGSYTSTDIWFSVPSAWAGATENVELHLYARLGSLRIRLHKVAVRDAGTEVETGRLSGVAFSIRGRPCASFTLVAKRAGGGTVGDGRFVGQFWADREAPSITGGAPFESADLSPFSPARAEPGVSFLAAKVADTGDPNTRFELLKASGTGALHVTAPSPLSVSVPQPLAVVPEGSEGVADGFDFLGERIAPSWSVTAHRSPDTGWYLSRGGYLSTIAAANGPALLNTVATGGYFSTAPSPTSGGAAALQVDGRASLVVVQGRPANDARDTPILSTAFVDVSTGTIKAAPGNLLSFELSNTHSADVWLHLLDMSGNPTGASGIWRAYVKQNERYALSRDMLSQAGIRFNTRIVWAVSSTRATVTAISSPAVAVNATYV